MKAREKDALRFWTLFTPLLFYMPYFAITCRPGIILGRLHL